jgi:pimeloyl-ACP methyl ester carboxylesterase
LLGWGKCVNRWGASSRPDFTCKSTEETESWFIDSLEEWRKAKNLDNFILLGHSLGGYIAARYALKVLNFHTHKFSIAHHHH